MAVQITAGGEHTCALFDTGEIRCWGKNFTGQLGQGNTERLGGADDDIIEHLPPVDLGTGRSAVQVSAGLSHTCAVLDNGDVKCWGRNGSGQLGVGHTKDIGTKTDQMGDALAAVDLGKDQAAKQVAAGYFHTCAILTNGTVKCWGRNTFGQLGQSHTADIGDDPGEMGNKLQPIMLADLVTRR